MHSGDLRRRKTDAAPAFAPKTELFPNLKSFDIYPKVTPKYRPRVTQRTTIGAVLSLFSIGLISLLVLGELYEFALPVTHQHLVVDNHSDERDIDISFDITFHAIPCPELHIDLQDVTGEQQVNVIPQVYKQRLDLFGNHIGSAYLDRPEVDDYRVIPGMGILRLKNSEQAVKLANEGCNLLGRVSVKKVAGNFHIALGKGFKVGDRHIHHFNMPDLNHFNTSHVINRMHFGEVVPGFVGPLAGVEHILAHDSGHEHAADGSESDYTGHFEYFVEVVPTSYTSRFGYEMLSYQYAFSEHYARIDPENRATLKLPGIFFIYKISPFMVKIRSEGARYLHFLTNLCAIIGGIVTVTGMLGSVLHAMSRKQKAIQTRKSSLPTHSSS